MNNSPFPHAAHLQTKSCPFTIEVLGEATATADPDQSVIVLGAFTEGAVLQDIQAENAKIITDIIQSLVDLGIPRQKIQTNDFRIEPQYDFEDGKQIFRGYRVTHLLQITNDQVDQTGLLIDTAVSHGANMVNSIQFTSSQKELIANLALSGAVDIAHQKAIVIANTLGVSLAAVPCKVQQLSRIDEPIPFAAAPMLMKSESTPIEPGQLEIPAAVRVWYAYG